MRLKRSISLLIWSILLRVDVSDAAPVNLNLKSGLLSRLLGNSSPKQSTSENIQGSSTATTTATAERQKGKVSLDLSGKYHCLVAGPAQHSAVEGAPIPLFQTGTVSKGWSPPSLIFSVGYNFSRAWYGATRLMTNLQWSYRSDDEATNISRPLTVNLQAERGLVESEDDYAAELGLSLKASAGQSPASLKLRFEQTCRQVTVVAPLHKRVSVVWRSIFPRLDVESLGHFHSRPFPCQKEDWWMPNLKINTAGRLTADNEVAFQTKNKRRVGVRLLFSRQLGWSAFGGAGGIIDDHLGTIMKLEVSGMDDRGESFSTLTMASVLERPMGSTQFILSHEQIHKK